MKNKKSIQPTIIVIFGITGDLSRQKLVPALFDLYVKKMLPERFHIVGLSRSALSQDAFRARLETFIRGAKHGHTKKDIDLFLERTSYVQGLFEEKGAYDRVVSALRSIDAEYGICANKLFYLAVPPSFYEIILQNLADSGLTIPCGGKEGWTRVLVEKPFGKDLKTAKKLDHMLGLLFQEEQIFRIDHYLAKETVQNILAFRFSNALFEPLWDNTHIEKVNILLSETQGVGERGAFYEDAGALRDVGQNHMLQMAALVAMENPTVFDAKHIRANRAHILHALVPIKNKKEIISQTYRGQYKGYRDEEAVSKKSHTETYFKIQAHVDTPRWKGVPFILESGKKMKEHKAEISVYFKRSSCLCPPEFEIPHANALTFRIQPDEGISVLFWVKEPGFQMKLEPKTLSFSYKEKKSELPGAYERLLFDCIRGDQTLFASTQEVEAAWAFITPILERWDKDRVPLEEYDCGGECRFILPIENS